jgi:hypothetical protein
MAESKPAPKPVEKPKLARAAESGDPAVQWLLAEQASHGSVGNTDKVAEIEQKLNDLGYTAK